ncbi:tyrosine--tRNA ligase [Candidatus Desantisbacteria bacterium CG_4_10_14_0_8_um_filter_48_22]|uniref:Tyrosine--tRNA ligase n=1 Tax=Candidatus Desantisbacteria bacterium CG_4_10_14_0_8_um_filter_48_22 TaxID=1974543 RepID=A0A2M7SBJ2_9BACT|nr:MAG: tyrosine--tRNA ligase [Candidatus Desantisbacteria bacterium CG1_02_49_89]PIV55308.1 MAG: tyrosine--tRNA ligase [Candidatus Desantisbacteria bacterium CG02_land_8_20_14_3_00_49_13]PIZ16663.1 MAG: tyrosine--tRNA ligase [Candidatus Desantisbacteria bacterium CG_4_10_14_0_8_um_filter_48_22]PJB28969.1 MAG: tyrosine--tRNA ligase [Candidatus Desantisbacteria bacterium CG_4_9_14_3_um_filter_50_7]
MTIEDELKIITRNVVDVLPNKEELKKLLQERRPLKIKYGVDPTAPDIHLGHTVVLWKLRDFQNLGHIVQFILGDFTAMIGDPSGRNEARKTLPEDVIRDNAKTYLDQVFKILNKEKTEVNPNSKWFKQMGLDGFLGLASHYTVARVLERSEFKDRFVNKQEITLLEFIYPLLQGYDSVMLKNDIEIGGTDQTFNLLVGRDLQKDYGQKEQIVLTMPLLVGTDGTRKMSKTYGNYIGITDAAEQMFGKAMSITDNLIFTYFRLLTPVPETRIAGMELKVRSGEMNPRDAKAMLASELVVLYHGKEKALAASEEFDRIFKNKELPSEMPSSVYANSDKVWIVDALVDNKLAKNKTEANRLIQQGAVELDGSVISVPDYDISLEKEHILKVGKRRFLKIRGGKNTV